MNNGIIDFSEERSRHDRLYARDEVIQQIHGWLNGERALARGWVLLLGGPGVGKSAIVTRVLDMLEGSTPTPHHFIRRGNEGWDRPEVIVQNLCARIEQIFPEQRVADVPSEARLGELLRRLSRHELVPRERRLVLVLDGLDEIANDGSGNPLPRFLPRVVPPGVVIFCSSRPKHLDWLDQLDWAHRVDLDDPSWVASNHAACRAFWEHTARDFSPPLNPSFVEEAVRLAEGNLLHAIRLRDWLAAQPPQQRRLTGIPRGLTGFLERIWADIHELNSSLLNLVTRGLGLACAAREALPAYLFDELLTTTEGNAFLRAARPFLLEEPAQWHDGQPAYRPYHESFREFVALKLGEPTLRDMHRNIAATLAQWPPDARKLLRRGYALRHAVEHRLEAGEIAQARDLCADVGYLEAKCREIEVTAVERDLEAVIRAPGGDQSLDFTAVLAAVTAEATRLRAHPSALPALLYNRLRCAGWRDEQIKSVLSFPGRLLPRLRLRHGVRLGPTQLRTFVGHERQVVACAAARDSSVLLSASADRTLRLWALGSGDCLATLAGHGEEITACALTPDGRTALSTSTDATARLWDVKSERCLATLDNGGRWATACAVSPDGHRVVVGSDNGAIAVWNGAALRRTATLEGHTDYITACLLTPDGKRLLSASRDQTVRVWDLASGACKHVFSRAKAGLPPAPRGMDEQGWITALALIPGGLQLIAASGDGLLMQWSLASGRLIRHFGAGQGRVDSCEIVHEARHLLCGMADGTIVAWEIVTGRLLRRLEAHAGAISACATTPDGRRLLTASYDRSLKLWELGGPESLASSDGHTEPISACAITPDGATAVSASEDRTLKVWDVKTGACRATLAGHAALVTACAISADGRRVLSGARDGSVKLWSGDPGSAEVLAGHGAMVSGCAITPEGRLLTASHDGTLALRSAAGFGPPETLSGHTAPIEACAITPDAARALSISRDGTAMLWDLRACRCARTLTDFSAPLLACALTPDGHRALLAREDGALEVRDLRTGNRLHELRGHEGRVFGCAVSPDGARAASASEDGTVRVWRLDTGEHLATLQGTSWFRCVAMANGLLCAGDQEGNLWMVDDDTAEVDKDSPKGPETPPTPPAKKVEPDSSPAGTPPRVVTPGDTLRGAARIEPKKGGEKEPAHPVVHTDFPTVQLAQLGEVLASFWDAVEDARMVANIAGLDVKRINLTGYPSRFWFMLLVEAHHQNRVEIIVQYARHHYAEHPGLARAARALGLW